MKNNRPMWKSLALYGFSSLNLGMLILGGYFLGNYLEKQFHWKNMILVGVLTGLFLGFWELFVLALRESRRK